MCKEDYNLQENEEFEKEYQNNEEGESTQRHYLKVLSRWIAFTTVLVFLLSITSNVWFYLNPTSIKLIINSIGFSKDTQIQNWKEAVVLVTTEKGSGSGFNIDKSGIFITNYHVIENAENIRLSYASGGGITVKEVVAFKEIDIAFLKVESSEELPILNLESKKDILKNESITVIGSPLSFFNIVTKGNVIEVDNKRLILDAPIFRGSSGSPVINRDGNVIGVVFATTIDSDKKEVGLAIPIQEILIRLQNINIK